MKTQIVQLEPHDDYISVRDRMGWGQTTRVLLVWPLRGKILNRRLDLILIKRHSSALGSQLAFVTKDRDIHYHADRLDIPVYKSVREAEQSRWRRSRKRRNSFKLTAPVIPNTATRDIPDLEAMRDQAHPTPSRWTTHPFVRISIFTAGVLSVLAVVGIFIPSAEIYITPASKSEMITIDVSASPEHKSVELSGAVPTYVKTVVVEGRWRTPASGVTTIPRHTANGYVTFTNLTDEEISAPTGTIVSTQDDPPVRFETTRDAIIPIGPDGTDIPVLAVQPGSIGNVESGKIVAIEGALGLNLSVNNLRMTRGGSDLTSNTPVEADYQDVFAQLIDSLEETARSEFELSTDPGDIILSENPVTYQVLEESYTPEFGEPSDFLDLNLRAEFQFPYVAGTDLSELAQIVMEYQIDQDFSPLPETLQVTQVTQPVNLPSGESAWKMQASWRMEAKLNATEATSAIIGLDRDQALQQLNQNIKLEPVTEIHLIPDWWPRLPVLPFRINVINLFETETISN